MHPVSLFRAIALAFVACLLIGTSAVAQLAPPSDGITVLGQGQASAAPDSTTFRISLSTGMFPGEPGWQAAGTPDGGNSQVEPVIDALTGAGVPEADITVLVPPYIGNGMYGPYGPVSAFIEFTIDDPDPESARDIIDAANTGAAGSMMMLGDIMVVHTVEDCHALQQEAMINAYEDARERAARHGEIIGVSPGEVTATRDASYMISPPDPVVNHAGDGTCSFSKAALPSFGASGPIPYDLAAEPEVVVYASIEVTFAMGPEVAATPAS